MERRRRLASRGSSPLQGPGPRTVGSAAMVHLLDYISGQPPTQSVSGPPASRAPPSAGLISLFFFYPRPPQCPVLPIENPVQPSQEALHHQGHPRSVSGDSLFHPEARPATLIRAPSARGRGGFATVKRATSKDDGREVSPGTWPSLPRKRFPQCSPLDP